MKVVDPGHVIMPLNLDTRTHESDPTYSLKMPRIITLVLPDSFDEFMRHAADDPNAELDDDIRQQFIAGNISEWLTNQGFAKVAQEFEELNNASKMH